jgi:methyl-accepting chemotaxis protein
MPSGPRLGALAFTLAVVVMGCGGLLNMTELVTRLDESATIEHALRNHLEADMMHDALRGDVLAAQRQALDRRLVAEEVGVATQTFTRAFTDHVARFRKVIGENK